MNLCNKMKLSVKMHAVTKITNIARFCKMCQRRALNCELYEKLENNVFFFGKMENGIIMMLQLC